MTSELNWKNMRFTRYKEGNIDVKSGKYNTHNLKKGDLQVQKIGKIMPMGRRYRK